MNQIYLTTLLSSSKKLTISIKSFISTRLDPMTMTPMTMEALVTHKLLATHSTDKSEKEGFEGRQHTTRNLSKVKELTVKIRIYFNY